ncbi:MAG: hypothetical protein JW915_22515 [Chitinispirillaceae bacterium]|nr:hypothetical protein [Chitinispirillaceae bacterium]
MDVDESSRYNESGLRRLGCYPQVALILTLPYHGMPRQIRAERKVRAEAHGCAKGKRDVVLTTDGSQ